MEHTGNQALMEGAFAFPASFAQQRLWFLDKLMPGSAMYNIPFAIRMQGMLNVDALKRSLEEIVARHETLRTVFAEEAGAPMQVVLPKIAFSMPLLDLRHLPEAVRMEHAQQLAQEDANRPFDLARGPLMRTTLLKVNEQEHVLLLNMHHIISDGWSCGVMMEEVAVLYEAFVNGLPSPLPELEIQYIDYTSWQMEHLSGAELEKQLSYWKGQLGDHPPVLQLPIDHPRPAVQTHRGGAVQFQLSKQLSDRLAALTQQEGATLYMTLLAAYSALLSRCTGLDDISIGTPIAGRNTAQIEGLIGFFVNTLVMRADLTGTPTFRELLARVRKTALDAYAHQDLPFERLVEEVQPERNMSHTPLFQTMFSLHNAASGDQQLPGLVMSTLDTWERTAKFDLNLSLSEHPQGLHGTFEYSADLFEPSTIERMAVHFTNLLEGIAGNPDAKVATLPLLTEGELQTQLIDWNQNAADFPQDKTIPQLFEEQAALYPEKTAVSFEGQTLTYRELSERANQLAHVLQAKGVGPDVLVGLCMERSLEMIVGLLGIVKAGGAYVPLDPSYPQDRIAYMLEDSGVGVLLTQEKLLPELPEHGAEAICLDRDWHLIAAASTEAPAPELTAEHLAYMIYTSGSTGKPKGVLIPHRGVVRLVKNSNYLFFGAEEVYLQIAAISFDAATPEVWGALLNGSKLVVFPAETPTVDEVVRVLSVEKITVALLTSGLLPQLAEANLDSIKHLKLLSVGGDVMSAPHAKKFLQKLPGCILANAYGPTENSVASTTRWLTKPEEVTPIVPIGRAIRNNVLYVLDAHRQPVPLGVPGELYVGGPGLARGYLNRPELTEEVFIRNPFQTDGSRLYKTGDLVRYLPDGNLEFMGRIDHQVKVRGFRIELGEIETVIGQHADVKEAIVIVREDVPGDKRITAYVVANGTDVETAELRSHAKGQLPEYMVPSAFVVLDAMPLTPNGKIDRKALPVPDGARSATTVYVMPKTMVQQKLAEIWADILRIDRIGQEDNFFELGGHSLLATRLMSRVLDEFGIDLPLRTLFEAPTLAELAARIDAAQGSGSLAQGPIQGERTEEEADEELVFPTSFAQQRLWFLDQLIPNSALYNIPMAFRVIGPLNVEALRASFQEVARRHETLRTTFRMQGTMPEQVIAPHLELPLDVVSIEHLPEEEREAEVLRLANEEARLPFDLSKGPLMRAQLVRLSEQDHLMMFTIHHIISDGWSYGVLIGEITALYPAMVKGEPSPLPELPIQYADFAVWQREYLQGEVLDNQINYWKKQLGGTLPILEMPTDFKRPAVQTHVGEGMNVLLPKELMNQLQTLSQQEGSTMFMTLLAAFKALLFHYTKQDDILVGTPIANRNRSGIEGLIGFFVNTLVLRSDLSGDPTFQEMVQRVRETALEAYQYQDVPFEKLVEELAPERDQSHSPIFQVMFALQNFAAEGSMTEEIKLLPVAQDSKTAKFDLLWTMAEQDNGLIVSIEYNVALFTQATMQRMIEHFQTLLEAAVRNPALPISQLPLMKQAEEQRVLELSHGIELDYADGLCAHQLFEQQAEATPDALAVVLDDAGLTYAELNARSNQLAHHLKARGVGPEVLVGLCMERSIDLAVATLAILKAGGAYVPLDPAHPKDRIAFILEDAQVNVLVTQTGLIEHLPTEGVQVVAVDGDWPEIAGEPAYNPNSGETLDNALYVIYTSGTTGKPKGVMMTHRPLRNMISWQLQETPYAFGERTLQYASMTFDISFQEYFCTLSTGGTLVLVTEDVRRDPLRLLGYLSEQGVHRIYLPFVAFQQLCEVAEGLETPMPLQLKEITTAGDQLQTTRPVRNWLASLDGCRLYNQYGPTECHVVTSYTLPLAQEEWPLLPPIGRPIGNTQIYILDPQMRPVPVGVPGEVFIGGMSLARGYLNREELTAEKFVADPFSGKPGARLYRTGDLARYMPDGNIEFYGRIDTQVKIRGYRIELGEIETILGQHPGVLETVVMAREETEGGAKTMLVAYVVLDKEQEPTTQELRSFLKERLPEYMVPQLFMAIDAVPLTPNRKIDRKALPAPDGLRPELGESYVAPRSATEELMAGIFCEVLKVERIGIHDHFFDMGGHSLLATQMISRIRQVFGMELPVRALFEAATVASLVDYMQRHSELARGITVPPIVPVGRDGDLPLSFAQQRLWFIDRLTNQSSYNMFTGVRFSGKLNADALERGLQEIVRRHEVLRTTFAMTDGRPVQVVHPNMTHELEKIDLRHLPEGEREAETLRLAELESQKPFDLSQGPLFRSTMLTLSENEAVLLFTMHHIVSDGWSIGVFTRELGELYAAFADGKPSPLPELEVQYADFAHWQRAWLEGDNLQSQLAHWKDQLKGASTVLALPHDHPRPPVPSLRGGSHALRLSKELSDKLQALCQQEGVTMYMTLLAALNVLLYRYTGQDDILVGSPIAGRNRSEIEPLIGFFVNTLVLRTDLSGQPTFRELLKRVRKTALDSYANQDLPFEKLVEEVQPNRDMSVSPLFQVMFAVQNAPMGDLSLSDVTMSALDAGGGVANFELALMVYESEEGQLHAFNYQADLFEAETIERMAEHLQLLLTALTADPDQKIEELPLLSVAEAATLEAWNERAFTDPQEKCAHDFVAEHAVNTPQAVAVECSGDTLTYAELDARANRLAHHLQSLGVGPDVLVGVCMEKSIEFVVAVIAVQKAGGAYVPIDPSHPQDRIAYMLDDAKMAVLLTKTQFAESLPAGAVQVFVDREDTVASYPATAPQTAVLPHHLAYMLYTSGSTGKPKAVMIEHAQLVSTLWALIEDFGYDSSTRKLSVTTTTFDIGVAEIFAPLAAGGTTVLLSKEEVLNIPHLVRELRGASVCMSVPSLMRHVAEQILHDEAPVTSLRTLFVGGEAVTADLQAVLRQAFPNARVIVAYGPTETTVLCTFHEAEAAASERLVIGRAMKNAKLRVYDAQGARVPAGVPGELYIGGLGVGRGYLGQPELTADKFVELDGERWYKSGDLVRFLRDGSLEFLGRIDHQVKIRGFRIEIGEIETLLTAHPQVALAVVVALDDPHGEKRLAAYVEAGEGTESLTAELRGYLRQSLPEYMIPSAFVVMEQLPLTDNGKVDRRALPVPEEISVERETEFVAPRDEVEAELAAIWEELLGTAPSVKDDFFAIGGHSLLAVRMMALIEQRLGLDLPLAVLFQDGTIAGLAMLIRQGAGTRTGSSLVPVQPHGSKPPVFFVHPVGGGVFAYFELARRLGTDQPFYGLQSLGFDDDRLPLKTMEEMAAWYITEIRRVQAQGPYRLGGWSLGGSIAFEMTRQLRAQGETVELLLLLDTMAPVEHNHNRTGKMDDLGLLQAFAGDLAGTNALDFSKMPGAANNLAALGIEQALEMVYRQAQMAGSLPPGLKFEQVRRLFKTFKANTDAMEAYLPADGLDADVRVAFFRASETPENMNFDYIRQDPAYGWSQLCPNVEVNEAAGNHFTILQPPNVQALSDRLKGYLEQVKSVSN